jgi:dipeptidyl-peptidase-4
VLGAAAVAAAQGMARPTLTPELLQQPSLQGVRLSDLQWHPDGRTLTFLRSAGRLSGFDTASGRERVLLSLPVDGAPGSLAGYQWSPSGREVLVSFEDDLYLVSANGKRVDRVTRDAATEEFPSFSPDGSRLAYVRDGDLYVYALRDRRESRVTRRASVDVHNGRLDWVYEEELALRSGKAYWWSPDGRTLAYLQIDSAPSPALPLVDFLVPGAPARLQRFPAPGDPNPVAALGLTAVDDGGRPGAHSAVPLPAGAEYLVPHVAWTRDSRAVAYATLDRRQGRLELRLLDAARTLRGEPPAPRTLLTESDPAWVNALAAPVPLADGRSFLWLSERSGPCRLYRCTLAEGACQPLTPDEWSVERVDGVDETRGLAFVTAAAPLPRDRQLYAVSLSGEGSHRVTVEPGLHEVQLSPDGRWFAAQHSTTLRPPRVYVTALGSAVTRLVEANAAPGMARYDTGDVRFVDVDAADGTRLQGRLLVPTGAERGAPRPTVVTVYGGPHGQLVRDGWTPGALEPMLASQGYVVWSLDNRGSGGRGHAFEAALAGELGRTELADQLAGIAYLRSLPFVDSRRLGIYGASYGGYLALYAAVHAPEVFQAVAAWAPVTDWRRYDSIYTERYLGLPADNAAGYAKSSILGHAAATRAHLLLIHGTNDDNVHLAHTLRLVGELNQAGIAHDLALHPGEGHGYRAPANRIARDRALLAHFDRWLKERAP